ncbi:MAG: hypothetical protein J2P25_24120 [Nocardiopsaceae bacterium]|nr:hypothetical protein [Nocardiopsaceae bacterium]
MLLLAGTISAAAAVAPFAIPAASGAVHAVAAGTQATERASRHRVNAVLLQGASDSGGYSQNARVPTMATWRAPDGATRTGDVSAPAGTPKGGSVRVWTDSAGHLTSAPLTNSEIAGQADLAGVAAAGGLAMLVLYEMLIVRLILDRRRMAEWDADWALTEPTWSHQR